LSCGACVVVRSDDWLQDLAQCTMMDCTPSALTIVCFFLHLLQCFSRFVCFQKVDPVEYPNLRFVSTGAEEMQLSLRNLWRDKLVMFNLYGPTEGCCLVALLCVLHILIPFLV
jgi:hypothetical protein